MAYFRACLRDWLAATVDVDAERICDIVLAADEALTNSAEHAFAGRSAAGTMALSLVYDPDRATVELIATDDGSWQEANGTASASSFRGRGLPLIRALSDDCVIDGHSKGTTVRMRFHHCPAPGRASAQAG